ncbi:sidekick-1 isoform X1 [Brachionus plicatilis]|uniref:Sidekick-1 isoform X1 n=1 Tax=Brachionus plicatilis TaxID=10195 RepID=A0A3M7QA03_BRAPC|nr:sidekick-1 isoform X1 [Brachionus plicatilis]
MYQLLQFTENVLVLQNLSFGTFNSTTIEICAINAIGQSPNCLKSKKLIYIEDRLPLYDKSMIQSVKALSSTEINVTWKTPTEEFINGNLYGYKISCINNELLDTKKLSEYFSNQVSLMDDDFINIIIVEPELNSILLNNLKPYKNYTILIQVINQAGESTLPFNEVNLLDGSIRAQTFESIPSMPSKILFSYISFTYLNLTFFKPIEPNGKILSYELWYENVPTESSTTKIVRQEISTNFPNQTVHISNLEPMIFYNFKVRCKTSIGWGSYLEKMVYTGPKLKKFYKSLPSNSLLEEAPLAPSKPVFSSLNSTHSILEWKAYSNDYELFIIEIKFLNPSSHFENLTTFEFFSYSNSTKLIINRYEKKLENLAPKNQNLCIFRVFSFNKISISEPSPDSDYIHTNKLATSESMASINFSNPNFYLNWWFLVIIALGSVTILIIVVLIMLLRGKNKKFVKKQQQKEQMQHKMNTIKLMKMNQDADSSDNLNSIYLAGSNQQLILTNTTNTLSRGTNNHVTLYEIRKSKRANNNGTLKTGTYVSPNGTLSRINIVDSSDLTDSNSATLIKQQQINSLNNPRVLGNLLNLGPNNMAQPNDYTTSKVGAFLINENGTLKNNHYLMPLNKNDVLDGNEEEGEESRQHLYFQHMATHYGQAGANLNFNYSSSDTENDSNFNQMTKSCASKRQIYSTFGRQGTEKTNIHSLPPPPPALLTSSVLNTEPENFEERRSNINYQSNRNANMYFDHQQVMDMKEQNKQSQPMYHYHQGPLIVDSSPPPAPPPPSMTHNGANTLRMSTKSPYIAKKPPVSSSMPRIQPSAIKAAASSHGEIKNNQAMRTSQNLSENHHSSSKKSENNNTAEGNFVNNGKLSNDNNSFNLSGDRVVMSNVAGSRRPVASGYSFF